MWLTVGFKRKKKLALNFLMEIHLRERFFSVENTAKSEICISRFYSGFTNRKHPEL